MLLKNKYLILMLMITLLNFTGCSTTESVINDEESIGLNTYTSSNNEFKFQYPEDWEIIEEEYTDEILITIIAPDREEYEETEINFSNIYINDINDDLLTNELLTMHKHLIGDINNFDDEKMDDFEHEEFEVHQGYSSYIGELDIKYNGKDMKLASIITRKSEEGLNRINIAGVIAEKSLYNEKLNIIKEMFKSIEFIPLEDQLYSTVEDSFQPSVNYNFVANHSSNIMAKNELESFREEMSLWESILFRVSYIINLNGIRSEFSNIEEDIKNRVKDTLDYREEVMKEDIMDAYLEYEQRNNLQTSYKFQLLKDQHYIPKEDLGFFDGLKNGAISVYGVLRNLVSIVELFSTSFSMRHLFYLLLSILTRITSLLFMGGSILYYFGFAIGFIFGVFIMPILEFI